MVFELFVPGLRHIAYDFSTSQFYAQSSLTICFIGTIISISLLKTLSKSYGKRLVLLNSISLLVIGSFICFLSTDIRLFLFGRFLQGLSSAAFFICYEDIGKKCEINKDLKTLGGKMGVAF